MLVSFLEEETRAQGGGKLLEGVQSRGTGSLALQLPLKPLCLQNQKT